ncbi:P-type ATPase [Cupriavidus basilensis]
MPRTGEGPGDELTGGAIGFEGLLVARTAAVGAGAVLAPHHIRMVEHAQAAKAPIRKRLVDQVSAVFVPVALALHWSLLGWGLFASDWEAALLNAVAVLVMRVPCARPGHADRDRQRITGTGAGARAGILIKDEALEIAHRA